MIVDFRYDRDFLLQFMAVCQRKPDSLGSLVAIGLDPTVQPYPISPSGSKRRQSSINMGPPSLTALRQASHGLGISMGGKPSGSFTMGQFSTPSSKMSTDERFAMSSRSASTPGCPQDMPLDRSTSTVRSSSQVVPGVPVASKRTRSKRSENQVKGLLNKLTMEKFDVISDQIITWANKSEMEKDGKTLILVVKLVFQKASDEGTRSELYARLCHKMMEQISPKIRDDRIRNSEGQHITGGHLLREYILNRCQEGVEGRWTSKKITAAAAATEAPGDLAWKAVAEDNAGAEAVLDSNEYHAAAVKARRQYVSLIQFTGELFKLQLLTERIMHEFIKVLLGNVTAPEEEKIEALCALLTTVGQSLDIPKARAHIDVYFSRMKELVKSPYVNARSQCMLQVSVDSNSIVYARSDLQLTFPLSGHVGTA